MKHRDIKMATAVSQQTMKNHGNTGKPSAGIWRPERFSVWQVQKRLSCGATDGDKGRKFMWNSRSLLSGHQCYDAIPPQINHKHVWLLKGERSLLWWPCQNCLYKGFCWFPWGYQGDNPTVVWSGNLASANFISCRGCTVIPFLSHGYI